MDCLVFVLAWIRDDLFFSLPSIFTFNITYCTLYEGCLINHPLSHLALPQGNPYVNKELYGLVNENFALIMAGKGVNPPKSRITIFSLGACLSFSWKVVIFVQMFLPIKLYCDALLGVKYGDRRKCVL